MPITSSTARVRAEDRRGELEDATGGPQREVEDLKVVVAQLFEDAVAFVTVFRSVCMFDRGGEVESAWMIDGRREAARAYDVEPRECGFGDV